MGELEDAGTLPSHTCPQNRTEFRCDWKSWCVRIDGHDGDCEPATPSQLYEPGTPLDSALVLAVACARCGASKSVRCRGSINEPVAFHYARFVIANVAPASALPGGQVEGKEPESESLGSAHGGCETKEGPR